MSKNLPRGLRNNNPLNIKINPANNWLGKVKNNTDGTFEQFDTIVHGFRAALYLVRKYISQGYDTPRKIITRWAPSSENYTEKYVRLCTDTLVLRADQRLTFDQKHLICVLLHRMTKVENGFANSEHFENILQAYNLFNINLL